MTETLKEVRERQDREESALKREIKNIDTCCDLSTLKNLASRVGPYIPGEKGVPPKWAEEAYRKIEKRIKWIQHL